VTPAPSQNRVSKRAMSSMKEGQIQMHLDTKEAAAAEAEAYRKVWNRATTIPLPKGFGFGLGLGSGSGLALGLDAP